LAEAFLLAGVDVGYSMARATGVQDLNAKRQGDSDLPVYHEKP
jgi:hypothetical protein